MFVIKITYLNVKIPLSNIGLKPKPVNNITILKIEEIQNKINLIDKIYRHLNIKKDSKIHPENLIENVSKNMKGYAKFSETQQNFCKMYLFK